MYSLVYVSDETTPFDDEALVALAHASEPANRDADITGYLSWKRGRFFQYLEGPEEAVRALMARIERDQRHDVARVLELSLFEERLFVDWDMRFLRSSDLVQIRMQDLLEGVLRSMRDPLFDEQRTRSVVKRMLGEVASQVRESDARPSGHGPSSGLAAMSEPRVVVGIGASAGGLGPLREIFGTLPAQVDASFVVVQHFSPDSETVMDSILQRETAMTVTPAANDVRLRRGHVYVTPPGSTLEVRDGVFEVREQERGERRPQFPIDTFFRSLAREYGSRAVAVVLSGTGDDGSRGVQRLEAADGIVLAQSGASSEFKDMPLAAIATGVVLQVLDPVEIAHFIERLASDDRRAVAVLDSRSHRPYVQAVLTAIDADGDFAQYKEDTLFRRIERRRSMVDVVDRDAYVEFLRGNEEERAALRRDLLITVTAFFRDPHVWSYLRTEIIASIVEDLDDEECLRAWVAGCATGEEAYTLAMVLTEAVEELDRDVSFKVYATDIELQALKHAEAGSYSRDVIENVSPKRRERFFVPRDDGYAVSRELRSRVVFEPHNMVTDTPFTRMHLITCRNVLIYMKPDLQQQVLRALHFALQRNGMLMLGLSETVGRLESEFGIASRGSNAYRKQCDSRLPRRSDTGRLPGLRRRQPPGRAGTQPIDSDDVSDLTGASLALLAKASGKTALLVDDHRRTLYVVADPHGLLGVQTGEPSRDVCDMLPSGIASSLMVAVRSAFGEGKAVCHRRIRCHPELDDTTAVDLEVHPQHSDTEGALRCALVLLEPSSDPVEDSDASVSRSERRHIEDLQSELERTRNSLRLVIHELESFSDRKRATSDQLVESNQQLQSTNEELQSVNQELHTVNFEYQSKMHELSDLNNDLDNLLASTHLGVIFLDTELCIRRVTQFATRHTNLLPSDVGRPFTDLAHGLPIDDLETELNRVLSIGVETSFRVGSRTTGARLHVGIHPYRTDAEPTQGVLITLLELVETRSDHRVAEEPALSANS